METHTTAIANAIRRGRETTAGRLFSALISTSTAASTKIMAGLVGPLAIFVSTKPNRTVVTVTPCGRSARASPPR